MHLIDTRSCYSNQRVCVRNAIFVLTWFLENVTLACFHSAAKMLSMTVSNYAVNEMLVCISLFCNDLRQFCFCCEVFFLATEKCMHAVGVLSLHSFVLLDGHCEKSN